MCAHGQRIPPRGHSPSIIAIMTDRSAEPVAAPGVTLEEYRALRSHGLVVTLGIEVLELGPERVVATMPVDERTRQPFGILHGGASVALAETVVSLGGWLGIDRERFAAVGIEINANHLRAKRDGVVRAVATPIHRGRTTQVWGVTIADEAERAVCVARCTLMIVPRDSSAAEG